MDAGDWISLGSAVVSVISLMATISFAKRASASAGVAHDILVGQAETGLRLAISESRTSVREIGLQLGTFMAGRRKDQLNAEDTRKLAAFEGPFREAVEDNLNAYEDACAKYLDNKIDKQRFKKMYHREIQVLCETPSDNAIHSFLHPEGSSKFQAIWKVYREWHHHEK